MRLTCAECDSPLEGIVHGDGKAIAISADLAAPDSGGSRRSAVVGGAARFQVVETNVRSPIVTPREAVDNRGAFRQWDKWDTVISNP